VQLTQEIAEKNAKLHDTLVLAEESHLKAKKACELRDQFIAVASHELRTPITALKLQMHLTQMTSVEASTKTQLQSMDRQVDHLAKLVNEMFDLSILDQGKLALKKKSIGVVSLLRSVLAKSGHFLKSSAELVNLSSEEDPIILADPTRLEQVFTNLLINATKYGSGKSVQILVEAESGQLAVRLQDQGIGIAIEDQERIFERFERNVPYEKISGLGLGLYISREIVRAHGGEISVKSSVGEGSVFSVRLPRMEMATPSTQSRPALVSELER
jgi:signal transduction histidine kinase